MTFAELCRRVRAEIGQEHRYAHSVRVARTAELLAMRHGVPAEKARLAGMLHDLARLYPAQRLLEECRARGLTIADYEERHPILLHARLGAELARERYGVHDASVLSAIAKHTTADAVMSPLDCVVYLADSLEPGRDFAERGELLALAMRDLHGGMRATLAASVGYLRKKGLPVAPPTLAALRVFGGEPEEVPTAAPLG